MGGSIRPARAVDAAAVATIYAPYVRDTVISFEEGGQVIGYAYAGPHRARPAYRWSVDVTVYVAKHAHRGGVGRALYRDLLARLADQGFHSAFAGIALPNDKSVGLHEAMGFEHLGTYREVGFKFGGWHDVGWWRLCLNDGLPTRDPIPFSALGDLSARS